MPHLRLALHCERGKDPAVYQKITPLYSFLYSPAPIYYENKAREAVRLLSLEIYR
jgi:hypothetical protein